MITALHGRFAILEPLEPFHADELLAIADHPPIWEFLLTSMPRDADAMRSYLAPALAGRAAGTALPFLIRDARTGAAAGTTRLFDIRALDRGAEIGHTWLTPSFQRTGVNTDCKYQLLRLGFESLGLARIQLKTDALNTRSRRAIERIGATFEGVLRRYQHTQTGRIRDTAMYSIIVEEWPAVRIRLESLLDRGLPSPG